MDDGVLFLVDDDQLDPFASMDSLSDEVLTALQNDLGVAVGQTVLPIAHWEHDRSGPLSIALNFEGELVALVLAESFVDQTSILPMLSTLEQWLAPMSLAELGELSGNQEKFVAGLEEMSPNVPIELASMVRILLVNPPFIPNTDELRSVLPFSQVEVLAISAFEADDGTVAISRTHSQPDLIIEASPGAPLVVRLDTPPQHAAVSAPNDAPTSASTSESVPASAPSEVVEDLTDTRVDSSADIDLTKVSRANGWPTIIRGSTYQASDLPLYFDPTGTKVEAISNELFAVEAHLALVIDLDRHDDSPFETSSLFRWGATLDQNELFHRHRHDKFRRTRTVHLFVECDAKPGEVFYVGRGEQLRHDSADASSLWFAMTPALDPEHLALLRGGQLPSDQPSFSFGSTRSARDSQESGEPEASVQSDSFSFAMTSDGSASASTIPGPDPGNWVPNV